MTLQQLTYLAFIELLTIPKGLGFYEGQAVYTICLILAFISLSANIALSLKDYTPIETFLIGALLLSSSYIFIQTRDKSALILAGTIVGIKSTDTKKLTEILCLTWTSTFIIMAIKTSIFGESGLIMECEKMGQEVTRYSLGYPHPNTLHITYLTIASLTLLTAQHTNIKRTRLFLSIGNTILFLLSYSYTGLLSTGILISLDTYLNKRKRITTLERTILVSTIPVSLYISIYLSVKLSNESSLFTILDRTLNGRFRASRFYLTELGLSLLPRRTTIHGGYALDNSYVEGALSYGLLFFTVIILGYTFTLLELIRSKRYTEVTILIASILAGISEPFLFNTSSKNIAIIFVGEWMFTQTSKVRQITKERGSNELSIRQSIFTGTERSKAIRSPKALQHRQVVCREAEREKHGPTPVTENVRLYARK